jgi:hypothetical protein
MKPGKITIALFFLLFAASAFAESDFAVNDSMIQGDLIVSLNKAEFKPGETLTAEITALSREAFPIAEGSIIVELVKGEGFYYPSSLKNSDNAFFEEKISGINLRQGESKTSEFSYLIPESLSSGSYRLDAYFRTERSPIVGITHIFFNPKSAGFTVKNPNNNAVFPELEISRTKTVFNDSESIVTVMGPEPEGIGPIGPPAKPSSVLNGKVFVENISGTEAKNIEVFAGLCEWDDSLCSKFLTQKTAVIDSIPANSEKSIEIQLTAPSKPTAYAIRLEARKSGKLISLYRNRSVVIGAGARVRKLVSENVELPAGKQAGFKVLISPSADHWLRPEFKDFALKFSVEDANTGVKLFSAEEKIPAINYELNFIEKSFSFIPEKELLNYKICAVIEKAGAEYDNYCTVYNSKNFSKLLNYKLETKWSRTANNSRLELKFCSKPQGQEVKANYILASENMQEFIKGEDFEGSSCVSKTIMVNAGKKYSLAVTDYITKTQKTYNIGFEESQTQNGNGIIGSIGVYGGILKKNEFLLIMEIILVLIIALLIAALAARLSKQKRGNEK